MAEAAQGGYSADGEVSAALMPVRARLSGALIALDFDGTLAPMNDDPDAVRLVDGALATLTALGARGARVAIVTGRPADTVLRLAALAAVPGLAIEAIYGAQSWAGGRLESLPTPPEMSAARADAEELIAAAGRDAGLAGTWLEDKRISVVVHTRRTSDPAAAQRALAEPVARLARRHGLEMHPGKDVLEIRLPRLDKGSALRRLLAQQPSALLYAGDDLGDVPAMQEAREWGARTGRPVVTIAVGGGSDSPPARAAQLHIAGPAELVAALRGLL